ncbi:MAG: glycogen debranching protein GlgX [Rhodomicrobium sp.]
MTGRLSEGSPEPLGLTLDERGANIAVFSAHATAMELCLFSADGGTETERIRLPARTGDVFHGHLGGVKEGQRYGLRAHGPYAPAAGHRFNPAKLLLDPYALALDRPFPLAPAMFGSRAGAANADLSFDDADSAPFMPKAIAARPAPAPRATRARRPRSETIIYELHVRGFTKRHPGVPEAIRGTFAGLAHPAALDRLVKLGVTAVEIMPCAAWVDERHLAAAELTNYWGYNPIAYMAPDPRLAPGGWDEVRASVAALHGAGIEALIDVVLNHTGEGGELGPTLCYRGLDNASYYRLQRGAPRYYINDAGCGNTLALDRPPVMRLALDSLRAWATLGGVDGFRFDLATALGRRDDGFDASAPLIAAIDQDPVLRDLRLIAEPWDIGPGGYQVGAFPPRWSEWNDQYRDTMRKFWRGDAGLVPGVATRFSGSSDIFGPRRRRPSASLNFIVAHDGFTLADLVSHERKHNEANEEQNRDGTNANYSWNNGVEGATGDPAILAARRRDQRNLLATLLLARGTPMLAMGAECGQTQGGNNNAYAQDNATSWLDWEGADTALLDFTARLIALRKERPALTGDRFLTGEALDATLIPDVEWLAPSGAPMQPRDWDDPNLRTVIAALYAPAATNGGGDRILCVLHAGRDAFEMRLPETRAGRFWRRRLDTARDDGEPEQAPPDWRTNRPSPQPSPMQARLGELATPEYPHPLANADRRGSSAAAIATPFPLPGGEGQGEGLCGDFEGGAPAQISPRSVAVFEETRRDKPAAIGTAGKSVEPGLLDRLARAAGIAPDWYDISGQRHLAPDETKAALLSDMGFPAASASEVRESLGRLADEVDRRPLPSALVVRDGEPIEVRIAIGDGRAPTAMILEQEDGEAAPFRLGADLEFKTVTALDGRRVETALARLPSLPIGRYRLALEGRPEGACALTVAPRRCYLPETLHKRGKAAGIAAQLYSVRRRGDQGIGDFGALAELAAMAGGAGFAALGLNPLHALFPADRERASPYYPSDRRFIDPIYIDVTALASMFGGTRAAAALSRREGAAAALSALPAVDYPGVWALKRDILEAAFEDFEDMAAKARDCDLLRDFEAFVAEGGAALFQFACFEAIGEARDREPWTAWPQGLALREESALAAFAKDNAGLLLFHLFLQWLCERQLGAAAKKGRESGLWLGFYRDLAVGAAPDGAESWANADQLMRASSVGAPPDPFAEGGQNWGLPPPNPLAWRRSAYAFFNGMVAANMRHAGALRIDHAMSLTRLFVIPNGAKALEGAYLSYPVHDLVGQLALESLRARCLVVGEDLGTVPMGFRETMDAADILSYRVFWFEREGDGFLPPEAYPKKSLACLSTHDLPTLKGWWQGEDIREKEALGLITPEDAAAARDRRDADKRALLRLVERQGLRGPGEAPALLDASIVDAMHRLLSGASSLISIAQLDDAVGEVAAVNLPGTDRERPNWRRKLGVPVGDLAGPLAAFAAFMKT